MATAPKFRIDVDIHNLLMQSAPGPVKVPSPKGATLPQPIFPQYPEKLSDPGPDARWESAIGPCLRCTTRCVAGSFRTFARE